MTLPFESRPDGTVAFLPHRLNRQPVVVGIALGVFVGGAVMRRQKRNRLETWLYRQVQWWVSRQLPALAP